MPRVRPLQPFQAKRSLANRLSPTVDRLRQLATNLGLRSRRVFLVWTTFDGGQRGEGDEQLIAKIELLPTPKVSELVGQQFLGYAGGVLPTGSLRIEKVSAGFTEAQLMGREIPGVPGLTTIPQPYDFFYEMIEDGRDLLRPIPMRYRMFGSPYRKEGSVSWTLLLERQQEAPNVNERLPFAPT